MKRTLLTITCLFGYLFSIQAQALPNQEQVDRHHHSAGKGDVILYGTTYSGGSDGGGTINKFEPIPNNLKVVHSFESLAKSPCLNLIQAKNGKLYGMTSSGGKNNVGIIFSFNPATKIFTKLEEFDKINGASPHGSLIQAKDGKLYGMTTNGGSGGVGVIFSFDPSSSKYRKLKDFDGINGSSPYGSLIQATDGKLYGSAGGVIFSFDPASKSYTILQSFGGPTYGDLMQATDGKMYGMTSGGGSNGYGVIFSFDLSSSTYTRLLDFDNNNGAGPWGSLIQAKDGKLYGMTANGGSGRNGVIFSFDPSSSIYTKLLDFGNNNAYNPSGSLMQARDGKLYGMAKGGTSNPSYGVIFSFDPSSSTYTNLKDFDNINSPQDPDGSLMQAKDGKLYGMENGGISYNAGVIFSFDPLSSKIAILKDFATNQNGSFVFGSVIQATDGQMYGMTTNGGSNGMGVIFSFDPSSSKYTKLKDFDYANGANPSGSLMQATNGKLYGMMKAGGTNGAGMIFSFDPSTSKYRKLKDFDETNGSSPSWSLIQASDGKLYGVTTSGGSNGVGVIFSFEPSSSTYTKLKDFDRANGANPSGLMQANDGKLYGTTGQGGVYYHGVIFSFEPSSSTYTKLKDLDLDETNGLPIGSPVQASDGKLYGMTTYLGSHSAINHGGVIFSFDPSTSIYTKLKDFDITYAFDPLGSPNGTIPMGSLMQASDGKLYGMTEKGGIKGVGVIFSFDPSTSTYTKLQDFDSTNGAGPGWASAFIELFTKPSLRISDATVYEAARSVTLTVTLSKKTTREVRADFRTENGTAKNPFDYTEVKGTVTIPAGSQKGSISVPIIPDDVREHMEQFYVELDNPVNAHMEKSTGTVTILDGGCFNPANSKTNNEQDQVAQLTLRASPNPSSSQFLLQIETNNLNELLSLRVVDVGGKMVEEKNNIFSGQTLQIGNNYKPGVYFVVLTQGNNRKQLKLIKL